MAEDCGETIKLHLVLHTAVDYLRRQGAGIGVIMRTEYAKAGISSRQLIPAQERKYGIKFENFAVESVKTADRAEMLAVVHALGLAHGTIRRGCPEAVGQIQKVTVFSNVSKVVQTINYHIENCPESHKYVTNSLDRSMIERIVASGWNLSRRGVEVTMAVSRGDEDALARAWTLAKQKGRQACKSRRQLHLAHNQSAAQREEPTPSLKTFELVIRTKSAIEPTKI